MIEIPWIEYKVKIKHHVEQLRDDGLTIVTIETAEDAMDKLRNKNYSRDLIVRDWFSELGK